jgi:hypothetical protein
MDCQHEQKTVRELGGEIWAEMQSVEGAGPNWQLIHRLVDVIMGVLARHTGEVIVNDIDLPVSPLPRTKHGE